MKRARAALSDWNKQVLVLFSDKDPVTRGEDRFFRRLIPTASRQPEFLLKGARNFLQEDRGYIAQKIVDFLVNRGYKVS